MEFELKFCLRTSMRLMTVAAVSAESTSVNTADTETVVNPIAIAENDSESESDEEQDNVISNTGRNHYWNRCDESRGISSYIDYR